MSVIIPFPTKKPIPPPMPLDGSMKRKPDSGKWLDIQYTIDLIEFSLQVVRQVKPISDSDYAVYLHVALDGAARRLAEYRDIVMEE